MTSQQPSPITMADMSQIVTPEYPVDPLELLGEKSFGSPRLVPSSEVGTPIQEFYRGASVLITGGTGFMGKALTDKLLRSCPHLERIYLLIRSKKGKSCHERLEVMLQDRFFRRLTVEVPDFRSKITPVAGDVALPGLDLSAENRATLEAQVSVVIHGAATVRFDEVIRSALHINLLGVRRMLELARGMKKLKAFVYISTAFSHCTRDHIDEQFYEPPCDYKDLIETVLQEESDKKLERMTPKLLGEWPNTYTLTKALAEDLVRNEAQGLPVAIVRPSIIVTSYNEPVRGWTDNPYGPTGLMVGIGFGMIHTTLNNTDNVVDMVPVDMVTNAVIASAWRTGTSISTTPLIYNFVSSAQNPLSQMAFVEKASKNYPPWPFADTIWTNFFVATKHKLVYLLLNFFLHTMPGLVFDAVLKLRGQKPRLSKMYSRLNHVTLTLEYFSLGQWTFSDSNIQKLWASLSSQDKDLFFFHIGDLNWDRLVEALALGVRVYLVKDDIHTLPVARRKAKRFAIAHKVLTVTCLVLFAWLLLHAARTCLSFFSNQPLVLSFLLTLQVLSLTVVFSRKFRQTAIAKRFYTFYLNKKL